MKKVRFIYLLCICLFFTKCSQQDKTDCSIKKYMFGEDKFQAHGCLLNSVEDGLWEFYTDDMVLQEKGVYNKGIRTGEWHYPMNKNDSVIIWNEFNKKESSLLFNIPVVLKVVEDGPEYIKFSNKDTLNMFNIVISIHDFKYSNLEDDYYKQVETEINNRNWQFVSNHNKIETDKRILYFGEYAISISNDSSFKLLNTFGLMNNGKLLEITCRYNKNVENSARIVFFSVFGNIFYKNERYAEPFGKVKSFK